MATDPSFVDHVRSQSGLGAALADRRMFGEYALYLDGKVVAFACDNHLYVKPTEAGRALLRHVDAHPPYPGGKPHFRIDDELEDRDRLRALLVATANALPLPLPKKPSKPKAPRAEASVAKPKAAKAGAKKAAKAEAATAAKKAARPAAKKAAARKTATKATGRR